jgi:tRNA(Ile2) C34 agmatinyltransferase TiaS
MLENEGETMEMIAACGVDCSSCPAYVNRNATDQEVVEKIAAEWSAQMHQEIKPENVLCDGCLLVGEVRLSPYCHTCGIRVCAHGKGYVTCAECGEYEACTMLQKFIAQAPSAGLTLASLRLR